MVVVDVEQQIEELQLAHQDSPSQFRQRPGVGMDLMPKDAEGD